MVRNDVLNTRNGEELRIGFLGHASLLLEFEDHVIYVDPVGMFADYSDLPEADIILVTHQHDDHFDPDLISRLSKNDTEVITTRTVAETLDSAMIMNNGDKISVGGYMEVEAVPAYNTTPGRDAFHPHTGRDNGYILTLGGTRIYIAGDGEPTPEMLSLRDIDIAFLPVNQPYTMTVKQAVAAVKSIRPAIFYPYHTGRTEIQTDLELLERELAGSGIEVRIRPME